MAAGDQIVHLTKKIIKKLRLNELVEEYLNFRGLRSQIKYMAPMANKLILAIFSNFELPIY